MNVNVEQSLYICLKHGLRDVRVFYTTETMCAPSKNVMIMCNDILLHEIQYIQAKSYVTADHSFRCWDLLMQNAT